MAYLGMGKIDEAWMVYAEVLANYPDDVEALNGLIQAGTALERWAELAPILLRFLDRNHLGLSWRVF